MMLLKETASKEIKNERLFPEFVLSHQNNSRLKSLGIAADNGDILLDFHKIFPNSFAMVITISFQEWGLD